MTIDERIEALAKILDVFSRGVQELAADLAKEVTATRELAEVVRNDHQSIMDLINMIHSHERTVESHERRLARLEGEK